jgi:hypothetical protein
MPLTAPTSVTPTGPDYQFMVALGMLSWAFNPNVMQANAQPTSQTIFAIAVPTVAGQVYTGARLWTITPATGAAPTGVFVGLATYAVTGGQGAMLAQSGNLKDSTALTGAGAQSYPFSAAYTETATGLRTVVVLVNGTFGGTNVTFGRATQIAGGTTFGLTYLCGTAQTALPANGANLPAVYSTGGSTAYWAGLY